MAEGRTYWVCALCGASRPLTKEYCVNDDCEMHRDCLEDEDAIPLPVVSPHKGKEHG